MSQSQMNTQKYLDIVIFPLMKSMKKKAKNAKRMFFTLRTIYVIGSAVLPFIIVLEPEKEYYSVIVSILVTITIGLETTFNFKDAYIMHEGAMYQAETLKADFYSNSGIFKGIAEKDKIPLFINQFWKIADSMNQSLLEIYKEMELPNHQD